MESKQGEPASRFKLTELEKDLARTRDDLAKFQKLNKTLARQAHRSEQDRKRQQETFELICRHGSDVLAQLSRGGKIGFVTAPIRTALGYAPEELNGRSLQDICHAADQDRLTSYLLGIGKENEPSSGDFRLADKNGRLHAFEIHACQVPHPQTQTPEIMAILRKKQSEARSAATQDDLAANLAHELNQPLTAIALTARACVRMARMDKPPSRDLVQAIENLAVQAERAGELVRRMRQFMSGGAPRHAKADLNSLAREALSLLTSELEGGSVNVQLCLADDLPTVSVDAIQIGQVIVNLARNAVEAMIDRPAGLRRLTLTTAHKLGEVELAVADTGPGLAAGLAPRLFQPFQTTKTNGMGLGLALSRSIVQAHGGRLTVAASAESGTTFLLSLPLHGEKQ